ncbi:hypothetical protein CTAYLR_000176 [Chrysophaeum taylorii]|uniref:MYND-type domain-containing protein n=1 Tax=Chrysophaeum taylorii TaxID=2483200 RepID=A0AAD7UE33_9STRA|nr:hypothetical protein CTAYLR_000176 [Chrysophaeum taylorii]
MESAETSKESAPGPSVTPVDPSVPAELTKVSKKPAAKRQRRKNLLRGECVCCVARLDADETARGQPLDLEPLLNIEGELPDKFYVCSKVCRDDFTPSKLHTTKGAKAVLARISASLTRTLKTTIRSGDEVLIEHDFSAGHNIQGGNGVVLGLIYNNTVCRVESYDVKTIQQGEIRVPFSHVKAKPDKENDTPDSATTTRTASASDAWIEWVIGYLHTEVAGAIRARAIIDDKLTVPFRFFAASDALEGWSVLDMAGVLERVHAFFQVCQDNPQLVATAGYEAFDTEIATYAQFLETRAGSAKLSVDGQSTIRDVAAVRARLYAPTDTNDPEAKTMLDALRAWGRGMRRTFEGATSELRRAFDGARRNSNEVEGEFGVLKYYNASYVNMSVVNCVGVVACQRDHMFDRAATSFTTKRRRRVADEVAGRTTTKARMRDRVGGGRLATLGDDFRGVLMEAARRGRQNHKEQAAARAEAAKEHHRRRAAAFVEKALERQVNDYAKAQEAMKVKPVVDEQALVGRTLLSTVKKRLDAALKQISSDAARSKVLKENIDRYVVGMGMGDLKPKSYTSGKDPTIGSAGSKANIEFLTAHLEYVYEQIKTNSRELVAEAVVPGERRRQLPVLGTATAQRLELDARRHLSVDELKAKVEECRAFRHPRKRTRTTSGRSKLPTIDVALVGSRVEVLWELSGHPGCYWMPGTIEAVSDENSKDGRKKLGLGWIFVSYDDATDFVPRNLKGALSSETMRPNEEEGPVCSATFVFGSAERKLLRCGRCRETYYVSRAAQRAHWPLHKMSCRLVGPAEREMIGELDISRCWERFEALIVRARPDATMALLLKQLRRCYDAGQDDDRDVETRSHAVMRNINFQIDTSVVAMLWAAPGMTDLLLWGDDLLNEDLRNRRRIFPPEGRLPYDEENLTDEESRYYEERNFDAMDSSAPHKYAFVYFNWLVGAAVEASPSTCSSHDGRGRLREGYLARAAMGRALRLWSDPLVREGAGDGLAPAASLASSAVRAACCDDPPTPFRHAAPGLCKLRFAVAAVEEANASEYGGVFYKHEVLCAILAHPALADDNFWNARANGFAVRDRAAALVHFVTRLLEPEEKDDERVGSFPPLAHMVGVLVDTVSTLEPADRYKVWTCAATERVPGHDDATRAFFYWILRHVAVRHYSWHLALLRCRCALPHVVDAVAAFLSDPTKVCATRAALAWRAVCCRPKRFKTPAECVRGRIKRACYRLALSPAAYEIYFPLG